MATKTITTKNGHAVEMKDMLTGREYRDLRAVYLNGMQVNPADGKPQVTTSIGGALIQQAEDKAIELLVVSVDGKTEAILDTLLNLPSDDYQQVIDALNEVTQAVTGKAKG